MCPRGRSSKTKDGSQAIIPGKAEASTIIQRILSTDKDEVMPPPESHKKLKPAQVETLKRWINEGAAYQKHWAFEKPVKPVFPVPNSGSGNGEAQTNLQPGTRNQERQSTPSSRRTGQAQTSLSPTARPHELIRRVTLDLTGIPPTPDEVDAFIVSTSHLSTSTRSINLSTVLLAQSTLWRAHGALLAGCGALWRHPWAALGQ